MDKMNFQRIAKEVFGDSVKVQFHGSSLSGLELQIPATLEVEGHTIKTYYNDLDTEFSVWKNLTQQKSIQGVAFRPSVLNYFMQMAKVAASRSTCIRAQVGAVIVKNKEIVSTGYNGMPDGVVHCISKGSCFRVENNIPSGTQYETCRSIHAEQNAIIQAGKRLTDGAEIFVYGHSDVCILCKRFIIRAGIQMVYLQKDSANQIMKIDPNSWKESL